MFALLAALGNAGCICMPWIVGVAADRSSLHRGLSTATLRPLLLWMRLGAAVDHSVVERPQGSP